MSGSFTDQLARLQKSPELESSLRRAMVFASEQSHREVTLEHILLALTEDESAINVLTACQVDIGTLRDEAARFISRSTDRHQPNEISPPLASQPLLAIMDHASAAVEGSGRTHIDGAVVLAAMISDGRSTAAAMLRNNGLRIELPGGAEGEQAQVTEQPMQHQQAPVPAPAVEMPEKSPELEDMLSHVRQSVEENVYANEREASKQAEGANQQSRPIDDAPVTQAQGAAPQPEPSQSPDNAPASDRGPDNGSATDNVSDKGRGGIASIPFDTPVSQVIQQRSETVKPAPSANSFDARLGAIDDVPRSMVQRMPIAEPTPAPTAPPANGAHVNGAGNGQQHPNGQNLGIQGQVPDLPQTQALPNGGLHSGQPLGEGAGLPTAGPLSGQTLGQLAGGANGAIAAAIQGVADAARPLGNDNPQAHQNAAPGQNQAQANMQGHPGQPQGRPQQGNGATPGAMQPNGAYQMAGVPHSQQYRPNGPNGMPMQNGQPVPNGHPGARQLPPPQQQGQIPPPQQMSPQQQGAANPNQAPADANNEVAKPPVQQIDGSIIGESIPRRLTVGVTGEAEVRVSRSDLQRLAFDFAPETRKMPLGNDITQAVTMRMRSTDDGLNVVLRSSETQWVHGSTTLFSDDELSWRWKLSPTSRGTKRVKLELSSRTLSQDGQLYEAVMPEQVIQIQTRRAYGKLIKNIVVTMSCLAIGWVCAQYGDMAIQVAQSLLRGVS